MLNNSPLMDDPWRRVRKLVAGLRAKLPSVMKNAFDQARQLLYESGDIADTITPSSQVAKQLHDAGDLLPDLEFTELPDTYLSYTDRCTTDFASDVQASKLCQQTHQEPGYLGIGYDEVTHQVTRNGISVYIDGPVSSQLIRKLIETEERFLPRHQIELCWSPKPGEYVDPAKKPLSEGAVDTMISNMRKEIGELGLKIKGQRNRGWKLISVGEQ